MTEESKKEVHIEAECRVKWFNQFKGYGFVERVGKDEDVFLHFSVVNQAGIKNLNNGDIIICDIEGGSRGLKVSAIREVIKLNKFEIADREPEQVEAVMKWFNPAKGFGFAQMKSGEDIFIHSSLLKRNHIESIEPGKKIGLLVRYTNFGYEAVEIILNKE